MIFGPGAFRLFLALVVLAHHTTPLRLGAWAVYVFFILSGYWIARMWEEKYCRTRSPSFTFLVSRWWRLAPVLFSCLAITVGVSWVLDWHLPWLTLAWVLRQVPIAGSASTLRVLPPQWSIDVEMQFYTAAALLLPALAMLRETGWMRQVLILAASLIALTATAAYLATGGSPDHPALWAAAGFFILGIWMWESRWEPSRRLTGWAVASFFAISSILALSPETRSALVFAGRDTAAPRLTHWPALWQVTGSLLTVPFLARNVRLSSPPLDRVLGNWAYPLYLFHWLPREWYYRQVDWALSGWHNASLFALNVVGALMGSWVIFWIIDRPVDRMRSRWVASRVITPAAGGPSASSPRETHKGRAGV
jgi:peptidoglycan/LPS O-acetylase OafA/YrhL